MINISTKINYEEIMNLKGGENRHLNASLLVSKDMSGKPFGKNIYSPDNDKGLKERLPGWTNIGDISACARATINLGDIYRNSDTPHIVISSKHTRPVVTAKGKTQLEAVKKALAGDVNAPFGGFFGFNTALEYETAQFIDKIFFEGVVAPEYEKKSIDLLTDTSKIKAHKNRFLVETGNLSPSDIDVFGYRIHQVACGYNLKQSLEPAFKVREESVVMTGNNGVTDINSLENHLIDDIEFAGNAAIYLSSNLIFFVHNGAIAGLGDGCGARTDAAVKARRKLEESVYAALSADRQDVWDMVLFDTPFTRKDFEDLQMPLRLVAFSDAFYPKLDGFVETAGVDRFNSEFSEKRVTYTERKKEVTFIPKKNNFNSDYNLDLIPKVVVQPGGSLGDKVILPIAEKYNIKMIFTMDSDTYQQYLEKGPGKGVSGRRFFGHIIM